MASHRPQIISVTPAAAVGDTIAVVGRHLSGTTAVTIDGTPVERFQVLRDQLLAVVAEGTSTGRVAVTTPNGTATSQTELTISADAPTIALVAPISGKTGDAVALTGTGFTGATAVTIGGARAGFIVESDTLIVVTVPPAAVTGAIHVTGPAGTGVFTGPFTYVPTPAVTSFAPVQGPAATVVVIHGSGFTGASAVTVGGTAVASFVVNSDTQITATLGSGTTGEVAVTNTNGTGTSDGTFTVLPAPTISSFTPSVGAPGTLVTVTGTNLGSATAVSFDGTPAQLQSASDTHVTALVPQGAGTGHVAVTTKAGTATSSGNFTPGPAPVIDYVSPLFAEVGDTITVAGAGLTGATEVKLGGVACTSVVVGSDASLTATIAAATPSGPVKVTTPDGVVTSEQRIAIQAAPTVSSVAPSSGAVGAAVLLTGTGFVGITDVSVNGTPAAFAVLSPTQIRATVPTSATTGDITVTNAAGTGTSGSFTVL